MHKQDASAEGLSTLSLAWMAEAYRYASSVRLITEHCAFRQSPATYHSPSAYLTGHALELALKACLFRAHRPKKEVKSFKHRLLDLWRSEECQSFAAELFAQANQLNTEMMALGEDSSKPRLTRDAFDKMIIALDRAYGHNQNYALKYPATTNHDLEAPRAAQIAWPLESVTYNFLTRWNAEG